jgi:branched-subunit amino acid transport protein
MSDLYLWFAFFGLMIITLITRGFFLLLGSKFHISESVREFLRYAPTAALIAIVVPDIFFVKNASSQLFEFQLNSPHFFGGVVAVIGFLMTKNMVGTIFLGMAAFTAARILF